MILFKHWLDVNSISPSWWIYIYITRTMDFIKPLLLIEGLWFLKKVSETMFIILA